MSLPVVFVSGADSDLQGIFNRFEEYSEGCGVEFLTAVEAYVSRIAIFPEIAPIYDDQIRRQVMHGFPYVFFISRTPRAYWYSLS